MTMYRVTAHLPIGVGDGVVETQAISGLFGTVFERHKLPVHQARQLASDLLAAAVLVEAHTEAPDQDIDDDSVEA